ncbi:hypothetical protein GC194_14775, partial [bacterium]|nr:hypothetical protein [bacterium]
MKRLLQIAFSLVFVLAISMPLVKTLLSKNEETSADENRQLKPFPEVNLKLLDKFPPQFNEYWADHFGFREWFISQNHKIKMDLLRVSPLPDQVIFGTEGWYFMKGKPYKCYSGLNKFTHAELKEGRVQLQYRADFAQKQGVPYIIFVAPNKHRIYEENL